jgi:hypothetical protein
MSWAGPGDRSLTLDGEVDQSEKQSQADEPQVHRNAFERVEYGDDRVGEDERSASTSAPSFIERVFL